MAQATPDWFRLGIDIDSRFYAGDRLYFVIEVVRYNVAFEIYRLNTRNTITFAEPDYFANSAIFEPLWLVVSYDIAFSLLVLLTLSLDKYEVGLAYLIYLRRM